MIKKLNFPVKLDEDIVNMTLFKMNNLWEDECLLLDNYELNDNLFERAMELIPDDPFEMFLNAEDNLFRSIHADCKEIESSGSGSSSSAASDESLSSEIFESPNKYEIRNHDCMWSGNCDLNKDGTYTCGYRHISKMQQQQQQQHEHQQQQQQHTQQQQQKISQYNNNNNKTSPAQIMQNIPPGASLLINSRSNQQKKQEKFKIPNLLTPDFLKEREMMHNNITRPDTPVSLDDDPPEFKHCVDLSACVIGSNNICLDADKIIINKLKEQLEDTSTRSVDIKNIIPGNKQRTLSEVLNVIENEEIDSSICADSCDSDSESTDSSIIYKDSSPCRQASNYHQPVMHSDHSYTRSKSGGGVDVVGLETPSDSDEEIDVVSIGDKKLPTNPSDKDRRAIQNKFAHKISNRIVKTPGGMRTIPPRRRGSLLDPPYILPSAASQLKSSSSSGVGSNSTSSIKHGSTPPYCSITSSGYSSSVSSVHSSRYTTTVNSNSSSSNSNRKRNSTTITSSTAAKDDYVPSNKRYRSKNKRSISKRHYDMDEADTIEKRNLHNDMERQRRIGLKNLFEALKKQIPNIKDKERAPKVNILREAAKLCDQLTKEDKFLTTQKQQLQVQLQRRQTQLKAASRRLE